MEECEKASYRAEEQHMVTSNCGKERCSLGELKVIQHWPEQKVYVNTARLVNKWP